MDAPDKTPQWFNRLTLWAAMGIAASATGWAFNSISALREEAAANKAIRDTLVRDVGEVKQDVKKLLNRP